MFVEIVTCIILLSVAIAVLVVIHVCVVERTFRGDSNNGTTPVPSRRSRVKSMKPEDIKGLPCYSYKMEEEKEKGNGSECAVCLESFRAAEKCKMLPKCNHSFHAECIDSWLLETAICPICRTPALNLLC